MPSPATLPFHFAWNSSSIGISRRQGPHHAAQRLTTIGPRRVDRSTGSPPPRQGSVTSGSPPSTCSPVPGSQSAISLSAFMARNSGVSTRSEEHTSELQSLMRISYAVFCLKKKKKKANYNTRKREHITIHSIILKIHYRINLILHIAHD